MGIAGRVAVGLFVAVVGFGPAAAATLTSEKTWGGPGSELLEGVAVAPDGSHYVAGTTFSFSDDGTSEIFLVKYGPAGNLEWQRTWEQPGQFLNDTAADVAAGADGSAHVVGTSVVAGNGNDVVVLKFAADGTLAWQRTWGGPSLDEGQGVAVTADGSVYVTGTTQSFTDREAFVVKLDAAGNVVWERTYSRGDSDSAQAITIGPDGNLYVAATSFRPDFLFDAVLLEITPEGDLLRQTGYAVREIADALGVAVADDLGAYLVGSLDGAESGFVVKLAPDRTIEWQRSFGGRSGDRADAVTIAADGTVWVTGVTNTNAASDEALVLQFSPDRGRLLQAHTWGGTELEQGIDIALAPGGDLVVGAVAQTPPWTFADSRVKASRLRGDLIELGGALAPVAGSVGTPAGVVDVPAGSETFAGGSDAAVLRITP